MITKVIPCERDLSNLKHLSAHTSQASLNQPENYSERVVLKPWGYEYLIFENSSVAIWFLHIKGGHSTSMHCHPLKRTSLIVLGGTATCYTFSHRATIHNFGGLVIEKGVFHSTQAVSEEGVMLLEIESPPNKTDLVRLNDQYGREQSGYEGMSEMRSGRLEDYDYFNLKAPAPDDESQHFTKGHKFILTSFSDGEGFLQEFEPQNGALYASCGGVIRNSTGGVAADVGEVFAGASLDEGWCSNEKLLLLTISPLRSARSYENN